MKRIVIYDNVNNWSHHHREDDDATWFFISTTVYFFIILVLIASLIFQLGVISELNNLINIILWP